MSEQAETPTPEEIRWHAWTIRQGWTPEEAEQRAASAYRVRHVEFQESRQSGWHARHVSAYED